MTLENKINEFLANSFSRFYNIDTATTAAMQAAQGHMDNLYETAEEVGLDADGESFLSDRYVARIVDRVIDELGSNYEVDAKDNAFFVELEAVVETQKAAA